MSFKDMLPQDLRISLSLFLSGQKHAHIAYWSFCRSVQVAMLLLFFLVQFCCLNDALLQPCPAPLVLWPVFWYFLHALEIVLGDTANILVTARRNVQAWKALDYLHNLSWLQAPSHVCRLNQDQVFPCDHCKCFWTKAFVSDMDGSDFEREIWKTQCCK